MGVFVLTVEQPLFREVHLCDSVRNVGRQGDVLKFYSCHSPPRSDSVPEVKATVDQMKHTFALITIMEFWTLNNWTLFEYLGSSMESRASIKSYQVVLLGRKLRFLK